MANGVLARESQIFVDSTSLVNRLAFALNDLKNTTRIILTSSGFVQLPDWDMSAFVPTNGSISLRTRFIVTVQPNDRLLQKVAVPYPLGYVVTPGFVFVENWVSDDIDEGSNFHGPAASTLQIYIAAGVIAGVLVGTVLLVTVCCRCVCSLFMVILDALSASTLSAR